MERRSMKLRCDVCNDSAAAVFCSADEAALCSRCDSRVHRANKLASRHQRFSLVLPPAEETPPCDICRECRISERRAFLFCQQDRAILCTECDLLIHSANEHTKKHGRFVLAGVKLLNCSQSYRKSADKSLSNRHKFDAVRDCNSKAVPEGGTVLDQSKSNAAKCLWSSSSSTVGTEIESVVTSNASSGGLSEYLMETLPGWQVDEFLESCCASSGISKNVDDFVHQDYLGSILSFSGGVSPQSWGFWVPQASPGLYPTKTVEEVGSKSIWRVKGGILSKESP